jgi:hypothetical protein
MDCRRASGLVTAAALGEIDRGRLIEFYEHISRCRACAAELRRARAVVRMVDCALLGLPAQAGLPRWASARTG